MKRFILTLAVLATACGAAFSNVELKIDFNSSVFDKTKFDVSSSDYISGKKSGSIDVKNSQGFDIDANFFSSETSSVLDIGCGVFLGCGFITKADAKLDWYDLGFKGTNGSGSFWKIGFGPSFRYTPVTNFSLSFRPGLVSELKTYDSSNDPDGITERFSQTQTGFNFRAAAELWTVNSESGKFHFGLEAGFEYSIFILSNGNSCKMETIEFDYESKNINTGRFFFGFIFNFGSRGYDRKKTGAVAGTEMTSASTEGEENEKTE